MDTPVRDQIVRVLEVTYGPGLVAIGFAFLAATMDPAHEVLLASLAEIDVLGGIAGALAVENLDTLVRNLLVGIVPVSVWSAARIAVIQTEIPDGWAARNLPRAYGAITILGVLAGMVAAYFSEEAKLIDQDGDGLEIGVFVLAGVLMGLGALIGRFLHRAAKSFAQKQTFSRVLWPVLLVVLLGILGFLLVLPGWAEAFGPLGIAALFFSLTAYGFTVLTVLSRHMPGAFPLIIVAVMLTIVLVSPYIAFAILAGLMLIFFLGLARDWFTKRRHMVLVIGLAAVAGAAGYLGIRAGPCVTLAGCNLIQGVAGTAPHPEPVTLAETFEPGPGAPMRLIAAQGGGLFAAYHTAFYLAARADNDPSFAKSVFAISGVSGGSVGAGIYWAIRKSGLCDLPDAASDCHRAAVRDILHKDYLSAPLAGFLFRDNLDNYTALSALFTRPIDRGRVLEERFARSYNKWAVKMGGSGGELSLPLSASYDPNAGAPLLLFNTTEVATGALFVLSPVEEIGRLPGRVALENGNDLSVATGMVTSARFPLVTPPARLHVTLPGAPAPATIQLVDGGYFDNSGIETLMEFLPDVASLEPRKIIEVTVFEVAEPAAERTMKGTAGAPVSAFMGAWRSRRELTVRRFAQRFDEEAFADHGVRLCRAHVTDEEVNFTVSWFLADSTFKAIELEVLTELDMVQFVMPPNAQPYGTTRSIALPGCPGGVLTRTLTNALSPVEAGQGSSGQAATD